MSQGESAVNWPINLSKRPERFLKAIDIFRSYRWWPFRWGASRGTPDAPISGRRVLRNAKDSLTAEVTGPKSTVTVYSKPRLPCGNIPLRHFQLPPHVVQDFTRGDDEDWVSADRDCRCGFPGGGSS